MCELETAIKTYQKIAKRSPRPFLRSETADKIPDSIARSCSRTSKTGLVVKARSLRRHRSDDLRRAYHRKRKLLGAAQTANRTLGKATAPTKLRFEMRPALEKLLSGAVGFLVILSLCLIRSSRRRNGLQGADNRPLFEIGLNVA